VGGLRNRVEMVDRAPDSWRTNTMGLGGGPQGSNLFPQAGRLSSSRSEDAEGACPSAGANRPLPICSQVHRLYPETNLRYGYLPC
jgi:hypothetical protein